MRSYLFLLLVSAAIAGDRDTMRFDPDDLLADWRADRLRLTTGSGTVLQDTACDAEHLLVRGHSQSSGRGFFSTGEPADPVVTFTETFLRR